MNEIRYGGLFSYMDLPRELTQDKLCVRIRSLKVLEVFAEIVGFQGDAETTVEDRLLFTDNHIIPVALIFGEIPEAFVGIKENVFVPVVVNSINAYAAPLKSNHLIVGSANLAAASQGYERRIDRNGFIEGLQNL